MKILCILNPISGKVAPHLKRLREDLPRWAGENGWDLTLQETTHAGHGHLLAKQAREDPWDRVVSCGGDGILNEVGSALVHSDKVLGILPLGSGNGLARHLGIPLKVEAAFHLLGKGRIETIDTGLADGHVFLNVAGLGMDAEIGRQFNGLQKRGPLPYFKTGLRTLWRYRSRNYRFCDGDREASHRALLIGIGNGSQYGNNARIAPRASVTDGELELVSLSSNGLWSMAQTAYRLFFGDVTRSSKVLHWRSNTFTIHTEAPTFLHTDGEIHECGREIPFQCVPRSLKILVP